MEKKLSPKFTVIAKTLRGLEEVLAAELKALNAQKIEVTQQTVSFESDLKLLYRANLELRTALHLLRPLFVFTAYDENELYRKIKQYHWSAWLSPEKTMAVDTVLRRSSFTHSQYFSQKVKDAVVDQLRDKFGERPSVDIRHADIRIHVFMDGQKCHVSLDSSGQSLHKRGYRLGRHEAPINEVLAAGLLFLSGYDAQTPLLDPMCGSGTILIEAALMASNTPPGIFRETFSFMSWPDFDRALWNTVLKEAKARITPLKSVIQGQDIAMTAIKAAEANIKKAGFENRIKLIKEDFFHSSKPFEKGILVSNPPYGERLSLDDARVFYRQIGDTLKQQYSGFDAWILSEKEILKELGLRPSRKIPLFNGPLDCRLSYYPLYTGSR